MSYSRTVSQPPLVMAAVLLLASGCGERAEPDAGPVGPGLVGSHRVVGVVRYTGVPRPAKRIRMHTDKSCSAAHPEGVLDEKFVYARGADGTTTVANVFVYVVSGPISRRYPPPREPVMIDQRGCRYIPHVVGAMAGQPIHIANSDATLHNVNAPTKVNKPFNLGMVRGAPPLVRSFSEPEVMVGLRCDVHPWMRCYVGVLAHPFFAVTGADGAFEIAGLPAGSYTFEAWHEWLQPLRQTVRVDGADPVRVDFTFLGPDGAGPASKPD